MREDFKERTFKPIEDGWQPPFTARSDDWGLLAGVALISCGVAALLLGIYLAFWLWRKSGKRLALAGYLSIIAVLGFALIPLGAKFDEQLGTVLTVMWISAAFLLRSSLRTYYRQQFGMHLQISVWKTLFFSSVYLNWCLAIYRP